ncbi:MAG: molybdopterin-dependent oxidoreductase [Spirochaetes bacterium]|nr:molybdopterin-dependent oxidoreductase [Spirochaetota bacterium]
MNLTRLVLIINGVERAVVCNPEKDNLAEVLRRMGLTGTKIGCGTGVCGACSIVMDGKVVRSCTKKMKNVPEYSTITTIEGIGTPQNIHPIQQAWITYGGVQCGFCSPGFIISAYALLQQNLSPTREEVREWFGKHKNVCRCTGYKPIVDAVMEAARVMRGEATMDDITYDFEGEKDIYGSKHPRPSALAKVTGLTDYGDDLKLKMPEGTAHLAVVISEVPHANIISIDTKEAETMPGVYKIMTAKDVKGSNNLEGPPVVPRLKGQGVTDFPVIAGKKIKKRGDCVALVAADTQEHARAAAAKVKQNLEILPAYMSFPETVIPNAVQIHDTLPNFYMEQPVYKGRDTAEIFEEAEFTAEGSFHSQHEPHLPIEPDVVQGYMGTDGLITLQCKAQAITEGMEAITMACGLKMDELRVIMNPVGGSFGYSVYANTFALVVTAVQNLGIPCTLTLTYEQFNHMTGKRSATFTNGRIAVDKDGKILGAEYDIGLDHGAYGNLGSKIFNNLITVGFHGYNIPNFKALARGASTNNAFCAPYRGFGAPQVYTTTEALIDMAAEKVGMDPWEFRYKNAARKGDLTINSMPYHDYVYPELLEKAKPAYEEYKKEAEAAKKAGRNVGVGMSMGGFLITVGCFDQAEVALELNPDGTFTHYNTWEDVGQGGDIGALVHAVKALEPMGIKAGQVKLIMNDSKTCPDTGLAAASRCHYMAGNATIDAGNKLMDAMRKPDGSYRTYEEMQKEGIPTKYIGHYDQFDLGLPPGVDPNEGKGEKNPTYMYCVNVALVEVDTETGKTKVLRYTCVSDVGVLGNRLSVEGQAYGGLSHSIGFALSEDYNAEDRHGNMVGCGIPTIDVIPDDINLIFVENPRPNGPHGSCGCSECYQSSGHMAVINAMNNACGVRVFDLPATPDKVKAALEARKAGKDLTPPKYFLGSEFEEELEFIKANPIHMGPPE